VAELTDAQKRRLEESKRQEDLKALEDEAAAREKRIQIRRERRLRAEAVIRIKRRNRMFKVAGAWLAALVVGLLVAIWFSTDFVTWLHGLIT
jgi:sRNA-binding protein